MLWNWATLMLQTAWV